MARRNDPIVKAAKEYGEIEPAQLVARILAARQGSVNGAAKELGVTRGAILYWVRMENIEVRIVTTTTASVNGIEVDTVTDERTVGA